MTNLELGRAHIDNVECARRIRADLKREFPGTKFSVRSSSFSCGSAVDVSYTDGPALGDVEALVNAYGGRSFNSSDESTVYANGSTLALTTEGPALVSCSAFLNVTRHLSAEGEAAARAIADGREDTPPILSQRDLDAVDLRCDAVRCPNVATTLVCVGCPQPAAYCDAHAAGEGTR
jgi:hypothetical protein